MSIAGNIFKKSESNDKKLERALKNILGFKPKYLTYYVIALTHSSKNEETDYNNERLEFLGDAILGAIVGEYLFKKYPHKDEGFLTEMRSKIVSRNSLNEIARKMGIDKLMAFNKNDKILQRSQIFGNALEALIGAIYLDIGYNKTRKLLIKRLISNYIDIHELEHTEYNFKNKLYSWAQKNNKDIQFETVDVTTELGRKVFRIALLIEGEELLSATGYNKKAASQRAAELACEQLGLNNEETNGEIN